MSAPSPSPDEGVSIGTVLDGRYRIDAVLGSGGMGRVYRGEHTGIGRAVAIKVLHAGLNRNREAAARFQREALASGRLDHPNIVGVSDFGVLDDGACFLVMEALEGESLGERLQREHRIPWREALAIMRGVLSGLRHAHERGVVHRDIKPDNVFLAHKDGDPVVKILDFGIAKLIAGTADDPAATRAGLTVGTPAYLSPEQAVGGEIKPASDIYSASILLFEMLTGRAPFEDKDPLAMLGAHVSRPPPTLLEIAPDLDLPSGIEDMVQRGLSKMAAERISSAGDYLAWVDAIIQGATAMGSAPVAVQTPTISPFAAVGTAAPSLVMPQAQASFLGTPIPGAMSLGSLTPTPVPSVTDSQPIQADRAMRAVSLAESPPIPRRWIVRGIIVVIVLLVIALLMVAAARGGSNANSTDDKPKPEPTKPPPTKPTPKAAEVIEPPPTEPTQPLTVLPDEGDHKTKLTAALDQLKKGRDCKTRRAAIPLLLELDDPTAIPALRSARYQMRGGVFGIGDENINMCLTKDADSAIKVLSRNLPPPKKR